MGERDQSAVNLRKKVLCDIIPIEKGGHIELESQVLGTRRVSRSVSEALLGLARFGSLP